MGAAAALAAILLLLTTSCLDEPGSSGSVSSPLPKDVPAFVGVETLVPFLGHPDLRILDARGDRPWWFGHLPGSAPISWLDFSESEGLLPSGSLAEDRQAIADRIGALGVGPDHWVVVVGDPQHGAGEDGRIAWMLWELGLARVSVLDGGYGRWRDAGLPTSRRRPRWPAVSYHAPAPRGSVIEGSEVRAWVRSEGAAPGPIVDVRTRDEYLGKDVPTPFTAARRGHIPGAVHLEWRSLLDEQGLVLPRELIRDKAAAIGLHPDEEIALYCTGGVRSAHTFWVLRDAGFLRVRNYAASFWGWSLDRSNAVERGDRRATKR